MTAVDPTRIFISGQWAAKIVEKLLVTQGPLSLVALLFGKRAVVDLADWVCVFVPKGSFTPRAKYKGDSRIAALAHLLKYRFRPADVVQSNASSSQNELGADHRRI